jgi:hypothetical protein
MKRSSFIGGAVSLLLFALAISASHASSAEPSREARLRQRGGEGYVLNCGFVAAGSDPTRANTCAVNAFLAGAPFLVRYGSHASRSGPERAYVGDELRRVWRVEYGTDRSPTLPTESRCVARVIQGPAQTATFVCE